MSKNNINIIIFIEFPRNAYNYLKAVNELGYEAIVLMHNSSKLNENQYEYLNMVKAIVRVDLWNFNEVFARIMHGIGSDNRIKRVISHNEYYIELAAYLEERLCAYPILTCETAHKCRDKYLMRNIFSRLNLYTPQYRVVNNFQEACDFFTEINKPVIIKPRFGTASMGVIKVEEKADFKKLFRLSKTAAISYKFKTDENIIVEEFCEGDEYSIESFMENGKLSLFIISQKPMKFTLPYFEENIYLHPSDIEEEQFYTLMDMTEKINIEMGIINGPSHIEFLLLDDNIFIIEIAARNGSSFKYLSKVLDTQFEKFQLEKFLGLNNKHYIIHSKNYYVAYFLIQSPGKGKLISFDGINEAEQFEDIFSIDLFKHEGDLIVAYPFFNGYIGTIYGHSSDKHKLINSLLNAHNIIKINFINERKL